MSDGLGRFLGRAVEGGRMPGAVWRIEDPGGTVSHGAVGRLASGDASPVTDETPYDLASLTKPLCTALLLALAEQDGTLDLEAPVGTRLPELAASPHGNASLLALATHTAGLASWWPLCAVGRDREAYLHAIARRPRAVEHGTTLYSDLGYVLLGVVLERAADTTLDELFRERIAGPLGLGRMGFATAGRRFDDAAPTETGNRYERAMAGEDGRSGRWRESIPAGQVHDANCWGLGGVAGHAGLFGTADEVVRLAREIVDPRGLGLGSAAVRRLLTPAPGTAGRTVGWVLAGAADAARGILPDEAPGHTGFTGTSLWLERGRGRIYLLLTNRVHPDVPARPFQPVRRAFHRLARRLEPV